MIDYGHEPIPATTVKCAKCFRDIDADGAHVPTFMDIQKVKDAERKAEVAAALVPYKGAIKVCQSSVTSTWSTSRCEANPKWVRAASKMGLGDTVEKLAVCGTHAKSHYVSRYQGETNPYRGGPRPPANEPLEPEYQ